MKTSILSFVAVVFTSVSSLAVTLTSERYVCSVINALGVAQLSYNNKKSNESEQYKAELQYGFLRTTFQGGALVYSSQPGSLGASSLVTARLYSNQTQVPYQIFLQPAAVNESEQVLNGVIGYVPTLGLMLNPYMMSPFYLPSSSLGFVIPLAGFVPTASLSCRIQFRAQ